MHMYPCGHGVQKLIWGNPLYLFSIFFILLFSIYIVLLLINLFTLHHDHCFSPHLHSVLPFTSPLTSPKPLFLHFCSEKGSLPKDTNKYQVEVRLSVLFHYFYHFVYLPNSSRKGYIPNNIIWLKVLWGSGLYPCSDA